MAEVVAALLRAERVHRPAQPAERQDRARSGRQGDEALRNYEAALASARAQAHAIAAETRLKLNQEADRQKAELAATMAKRTADAEARIAAAKTAAMANVRQIATDTSAAIMTRLLGAAPDSTALKAAIDAALSARKD